MNEKRILLPTDDPAKQVGFRVKDGCFQPVEVTTAVSAPVIDGNVETRVTTETTIILQSLNPTLITNEG